MIQYKARFEELPYLGDSANLFQSIANEPWAVFLDSGFPLSSSGRYDIIACNPYRTLITRGCRTQVSGASRNQRVLYRSA